MPLREQIAREAAAIVDRLSDGREFEAMSTLASHVPVTIIADRVGLKDIRHEQLTQWASATFDAFGPLDRARPALIPGVINECVRLASPLRGFTRYALRDFALSESTIPAGSRIWHLYASANRDERHYPDPDRFDIHRNPRDHIGWRHGVHSCVGMHLARMELEVILETLAAQLQSIEAGEPTRLVNNSARGYATLPRRLRRA